jgi:hypothetical protein
MYARPASGVSQSMIGCPAVVQAFSVFPFFFPNRFKCYGTQQEDPARLVGRRSSQMQEWPNSKKKKQRKEKNNFTPPCDDHPTRAVAGPFFVTPNFLKSPI